MKSKLLVACFIIFSLFYGVNQVKATSTASTGINQLYIRTLPNKNSASKYLLDGNTVITLIEDSNVNDNGCKNNWFKIQYQSYTGYVCSDYLVNVVWDTNETPKEPDPVDIQKLYEQELEKFPDDYKTKIEALHKIYPNAIFKAKTIDVSFDAFATYQYQGYAKGELPSCSFETNKGKSLIEDTNRSMDGLKSLESWAYNPLTDTFNTNFVGGQVDRWYIPSLNTVEYYVDPRNFLDKRQIFMFEKLNYAGDYYLESDIEKMLTNTFMYKKNVTGKENTTFAKTFIEAGKKHNVNPYFLVSRVLQEIGNNRSTLVSGTWTEYNKEYYGYYNFYNIKTYAHTSNKTIKAGLSYAKSQGWDNEYDAIVGGAAFIDDGYISKGQDTNYYQKFDTNGPCYAYHQYMQNIEAPSNEACKVYNGYEKVGLLQGNFVFSVPVYKVMPTKTSLDDPRNKNNYLRDLTINGSTIEGFSYTKNEYTINVSRLIDSVEIAATKSSTKSKVTGTGNFKLTGVSQTKDIVVTAENGDTRTYKVTVTKDEEIPVTVSEILNTMLVKNDGTYISGIALNTTANTFIDKAKLVDKNVNVVIKSNDGKIKTEEILATGDTITMTSGDDTKSFMVVIYGDLTGDGLIDSVDLLKIRKHLIGMISLKDAYKIAANVTKTDGLIDSVDLLKIKKHLIGSVTIVQ